MYIIWVGSIWNTADLTNKSLNADPYRKLDKFDLKRKVWMKT